MALWRSGGVRSRYSHSGSPSPPLRIGTLWALCPITPLYAIPSIVVHLRPLELSHYGRVPDPNSIIPRLKAVSPLAAPPVAIPVTVYTAERYVPLGPPLLLRVPPWNLRALRVESALLSARTQVTEHRTPITCFPLLWPLLVWSSDFGRSSWPHTPRLGKAGTARQNNRRPVPTARLPEGLLNLFEDLNDLRR